MNAFVSRSPLKGIRLSQPSRQRNEAASLCHMPRNEAAHSEIKAGSDLALGRGRCLHMGWAEAGFEGTGQLTHHGAALDQQIGLVEEEAEE